MNPYIFGTYKSRTFRKYMGSLGSDFILKRCKLAMIIFVRATAAVRRWFSEAQNPFRHDGDPINPYIFRKISTSTFQKYMGLWVYGEALKSGRLAQIIFMTRKRPLIRGVGG